MTADFSARYVRWIWCRAVLHRGWWLVTSVYLVVDAHLTASQLVLIGVAQALVGLVLEIPAGVLADTVSRKWSLVVSHLLMGTAMLATGMAGDFPALVATQMLWGLSWAVAGGADVAWISDELGDPARVPVVLLRAERAQLTGTVAGLAALGGLAWIIGRGPAMILAGAAMLVLGLGVAAGFPERQFVAVPARRWRAAWSILGGGVRLVLGSRVLIAVFAATLLVNGVAGAFGRIYPLRLAELAPGLDPVLWFTGLGVVTCLAGSEALRHIGELSTIGRKYAASCAIATAGVLGLAFAPDAITGSLAVLVAAGALPLARSLGMIWVNGRAAPDVRATVHSLLAQVDYVGTIGCGLAVAVVADGAGFRAALTMCAALPVVAVVLVRRSASGWQANRKRRR
ncbi:MFS transporter [Paractinoplanes hotanensis]|uniref:MFS transporter n=1 Tax=Paractinoplanes hotanensis TaxID=2906497 RepID=A0ABT0XXZ6_9ACTN|nr:MFS transporter [Actinoplanes hotanensis]MCM4078666.1 MFS transporter [Actinoplanes hotanensis]